MIEGKPEPKVEEQDGGGRVIYARSALAEDGSGGPSDDESRGAGTPSLLDRGSLAPMLTPLLIGFTMLVGLVIGLGVLSVRSLNVVSRNTSEQERQQSAKLNLLLKLRMALNKLDNEARARARVEAGTTKGLMSPFDLRLRNARNEVKKQLESFEHLQLAGTEKGRAFREKAHDFVTITEDTASYSVQGFAIFRDVDTQLGEFFDQESWQWESLAQQRENSLKGVQREIDFLTIIAALTGLVVATGTTWEVQRRFRQMRRGLDAVRRERQFSAQMLEGMVSAVAAIDQNSCIRSANAAFLDVFPRAAVGASVHESASSPEETELLATTTGARVELATYRGRWVLPHGSGSRKRTFDVYSSPLEIEGGRGQILTMVDATEAAEAEGEMRRQESLAAVGQAAAQLAHEIKNPLGSIRLGVAMLRDMAHDDNEAITTINLVDRGIDHLNKLTSDVTQFSRRRQLTLGKTDLNEVIDASLDLIADKTQEKSTPVEKHFSAEPLVAECDGDQLRQVFVNLFANAVDASPVNSPVTITTERVSGERRATRRSDGNGDTGVARTIQQARITIADQGSGIDEATRARIFEPFFTTKRRGTGLGLAVAKQIVEQHGGRIFVESTEGEGTRFIIELPLSVSNSPSAV